LCPYIKITPAITKNQIRANDYLPLQIQNQCIFVGANDYSPALKKLRGPGIPHCQLFRGAGDNDFAAFVAAVGADLNR